MTALEYLLAFAVAVAAWWVVALVANDWAGSRIARLAGEAADRIRQSARTGPPPLPPTVQLPDLGRVRIDLTTGTADTGPAR